MSDKPCGVYALEVSTRGGAQLAMAKLLAGRSTRITAPVTLPPGTRVGPFEVTSRLGAGGMGEVYQATDTNLKRQVALKVLPDSLAGDAERLARFRREAELLASVSHPNVAAVYGLERSGTTTALVMELVDGETLADRIARGPIPLDEARPIATQMAEALAAAHDLGIVHRDLKPANVKVRPDGTVKVLDFGLAKSGDGAAAATGDLTNSPTFTAPAMTQAGAILGTAAYMSPEQARGRVVDKRADVWAFGCVLFEMVTGRRAFAGDNVTDTLAAVVTWEPDLDTVPAELRPLLQRCLQKDPKKRLRDVAGIDVLWDLGRAQSSAPAAAQASAIVQPAMPRRLPWAIAAALAITTVVSTWSPWRASPAANTPLLARLDVELGPGAVAGSGVSVILSPDGTRVVYVARNSENRQVLYTRRLDQTDATLLLGTEGSFHQPFFSPDGQWVGFRSDDGLFKKVSVQGGSATVVGPWPGTRGTGASWGDDGNVVFGTDIGLVSVPSGGGTARQVTSELIHYFPDVLPGSKAVLYSEDDGRVTVALDQMTVNVVRIDSGERKRLVDRGYWPRYVPASPGTGYLTYIVGNTLFAAGFDPDRLELTGAPVPVLDDVAANADYFAGGGQLAVSRNGSLVYLSGGTTSTYPLVWLDPAGKVTPLAVEPGLYGAPRVSPDGTRVAYLARGSKGYDVWIHDLVRNTAAQRTFLGAIDVELAWAPDSAHLVYGDGTAMWWVRADGAGQPQRLADNLTLPRPFSFAPLAGGKTRLAFAVSSAGLPDVMTLPLDLTDADHPTAGPPEPFLAERTTVEVDPAFSPDGRFIAYAAGMNGMHEEAVYVRPFPGPGGQWKVSTSGGKAPVWSPATQQLLFMGGDDRIMAADYTIAGNSFSSGAPYPWSPTPVRRLGVQQNFDLAPGGRRILVFPQPETQRRAENLHATFVFGFGAELGRILRGR